MITDVNDIIFFERKKTMEAIEKTKISGAEWEIMRVVWTLKKCNQQRHQFCFAKQNGLEAGYD